MAPSTRAPAAASSSPLYLRMKAEAKKDYETRGKTRRNAMPQAIRSSIHKAAVAQSTRAAPATRASTSGISIPTADTPFTRSTKRKCDATEEEETNTKKQKVPTSKQSTAGKRKRVEDDSISEEKNIPREVKKLRSTASKARVAKKDEHKVAEATSARSSRAADKAKKSRSSTTRPTTLTSSIGNLHSIEGMPVTSSQRSDELEEVTTEGDGFFYSRTTFASNHKVPTYKDNIKGKQATKGNSTKVKKEERKGEMEAVRKGESDKQEETKGQLYHRSFASYSSLQLPKTSKTSTPKRSRHDPFYVEDDYDTETGEPLNNDSDFHSDSDSDTDTDFDSPSTSAPAPSSSTRPSTDLKQPIATPDTSIATTTTDTASEDEDEDDEDDIPTISSQKVRRELAGLPTEENEEDAKVKHKNAFAEYIDYGNEDYEYLWSRDGRPTKKTSEEKKKRTDLEKRNDAMRKSFFDIVDHSRKASVKKAMRNYKPADRRAIE